MNSMTFWGKFDLQHATFNGQRGNVNVNYSKSRNFNTTTKDLPSMKMIGPKGGVVSMNTSGGATSVAQASAQSAALVYNISLAANRAALVAKLMQDIANDLSASIELYAPSIGQGGVLCGYSVTRSKNPDPMGQYIFSYNHDVAVIGSGRNSLDVYRQALSGPTTIGKPKQEYRPVNNPLAVRDIGYAWVYRQAK